MSAFRAADVRQALEVVESIGGPARADPFPLETLEALGALAGADAVGYCESPLADGYGGYELGTRPPPRWLLEALRRCARQDPTHPIHCRGAAGTVAVSDFLSARAVRGREVYAVIWRPLGLADSLRLYLPAPRGGGVARFFFLDRSTRGFPDRSRRLLELLRPALARTRAAWQRPAPEAACLSAREAEILGWVALGLTNDQVARRLWISPHTVRTHLQHIYRKLGARTRTQAVRALDGPAPDA